MFGPVRIAVEQASKRTRPSNRDQQPASNWVETQASRVKRHGWFTALAIIFTTVASLGAFTDALDWTLSGLQGPCQKVRLCDPPPPEWLVGTLTEVRLGAANVPQAAAWAERSLATPSELTQGDLAWPGRFVTYRVEFRGLVDAVCFVRWTLLDAVSEERVQGRHGWKTIHARAFPDSRWTVEANQEDAAIGTLWVPYLAPGTFVVEVELLNADGQYLDIERTPPFTVTEDDLARLAPG